MNSRTPTPALRRLFNACLLKPSDIPPSQEDLEVIGVFNPGVTETDDGVLLMVRVAEQSRERRPGFTALPRWDFLARVTPSRQWWNFQNQTCWIRC